MGGVTSTPVRFAVTAAFVALVCVALVGGCQSAGERTGSIEGTSIPWSRIPAAQSGGVGLPPREPPQTETRTPEPALPTLVPPPATPEPPGTSTVPNGPAVGEPVVAGVTASGMHVERHDGFDRIVYDFGGIDSPSWRAEYVAEATQRGKETATQIAGRSILQIHFFDTVPPAESGIAAYSGPNPLSDPAAHSVVEVHLTPNYEGATQSFVGLRADHPQFRVGILTEPIRIAVDVYD